MSATLTDVMDQAVNTAVTLRPQPCPPIVGVGEQGLTE